MDQYSPKMHHKTTLTSKKVRDAILTIYFRFNAVAYWLPRWDYTEMIKQWLRGQRAATHDVWYVSLFNTEQAILISKNSKSNRHRILSHLTANSLPPSYCQLWIWHRGTAIVMIIINLINQGYMVCFGSICCMILVVFWVITPYH